MGIWWKIASLRVLALGASVLGLWGCASNDRPGSRTVHEEPNWGELARLQESEHLIAEPRAAEAFLGHVATKTETGWSVARELQIDCRLQPKSEPNGVHNRYAQSLEKTGGFHVGKEGWARLYAAFGSHVRVVFDVTTDAIIEVDTSGCGKPGEYVIYGVKVGRGARTLESVSTRAGGVETSKWALLKADGGGYDGVETQIDWQRPLAWSFSVEQIKDGSIGLSARPSTAQVEHGSQYEIELSARRQVWVVVVLEEADGRLSLLYPHAKYRYIVPASELLRLPVVAELRDGVTPTQDRVQVYGLTSEEDFEALRPSSGFLDARQVASYVDDLERRLSRLDQSEWEMVEFSVQIGATPTP